MGKQQDCFFLTTALPTWPSVCSISLCHRSVVCSKMDGAALQHHWQFNAGKAAGQWTSKIVSFKRLPCQRPSVCPISLCHRSVMCSKMDGAALQHHWQSAAARAAGQWASGKQQDCFFQTTALATWPSVCPISLCHRSVMCSKMEARHFNITGNPLQLD